MLILNDILSAFHFVQNNQDKIMPIKTAYKFTKLGNAIEEDIAFFKEKYSNIINGEMSEDEKEIAASELLSVAVSTVLPKFSIEELDSIEITPAQLNTLAFLIEE